jgi:putative RecB family exonuclease
MAGPLTPIVGRVAPPAPLTVKRRFSVTSDVVAFRRCARQYAALHIDKYAPSQQTQLFFGTVIHQVLDRAHSHYQGIPEPATAGTLPSDTDIDTYFNEVENGLKSRGIRAITSTSSDQARRVVKYFNQLEGPTLYPLVRDTEHRLQADLASYILHGVVDLLSDPTFGGGSAHEWEMWDYKGKSRLSLTPQERQTYEFQMRVYAHLFERKHGVLPAKAVLYFVNELDGPTPPTKRPANAMLEVDLAPALVAAAVADFGLVVSQIETSRASRSWAPAVPGSISKQDCAVCDLQWDCPTSGSALRFP